METLDIAFISKFISKEYAQDVIKSLTATFKKAKIADKLLKTDVGVILGGMILKNFDDFKFQSKLMGKIGMRHIEKEIDKIVYDEYGDILDKKDEEIEAKNQVIKSKNDEIKRYKDKIKQLNELKDLDSPEAKQIINSLLLL